MSVHTKIDFSEPSGKENHFHGNIRHTGSTMEDPLGRFAELYIYTGKGSSITFRGYWDEVNSFIEFLQKIPLLDPLEYKDYSGRWFHADKEVKHDG